MFRMVSQWVTCTSHDLYITSTSFVHHLYITITSLTNNKLMAKLARAVFLEDMFLETMRFHRLEGCQRSVCCSGRVLCISRSWWWGRGWHRIRWAEQNIRRKFELAVGAQEKVLNALASQDGLERERALETL